ncbi:DUF3313 family protein [Segnochrobactrum spirostomi]|nr:DUF3313 family protein [Segnochrobactrum spirostomi]
MLIRSAGPTRGRDLTPGAEKSRGGKTLAVALIVVCAGLSGCASTPLAPSDDLAGEQGLVQKNGLRAKMLVRVDKKAVEGAKTVRIEPVTIATNASKKPLNDKDRRLLENAIGRRICDGLAQGYQVVTATSPADLTVDAEITYVGTTEGAAAAASKAVSIATSALTPVPLVPRLPIGLGGLEVQAAARDPAGKRVAVLVWSRGADMFTTGGRMSDVGDAYALSDDFGSDFTKMVTTGTDPVSAGVKLPTLIGHKSSPVCDQYGQRNDIANFVGDQLGLPPDWTDQGGNAGAGTTSSPAPAATTAAAPSAAAKSHG